MWKQAPNGSYYEMHDPGNIFFMAPVALLGLRVAPAIDWQGPEGANRLVLGLISLAHCLLAALGSTLMLSAFLTVLSPRSAVAVALVYVAGTIYLPYTKLNLDVLGCAVASAGLLAGLCHALQRRGIDGLLGAGLGAALGGIMLFRTSVAPFALLGTAVVLAWTRPRITPAGWVALIGVCGAAIASDLSYNAVRMGSPFRLGTMHPSYAKTNALAGSIGRGLVGLTIRPSRGILIHCPVVLLLVAWPWVRRRFSDGVRVLVPAMLVACCLPYVLLISKMVSYYGRLGWGPRYLLAILPFLYFPAGLALATLWRQHRRILGALVLASVAANVLPTLLNPFLVTLGVGEGNRAEAWKPCQHIAALQALGMSLAGRPYPDPQLHDFYMDGMDLEAARAESLIFPNSWTIRLMREPRWRTLGIGAAAVLSAIAVLSAVRLRRLLKADPPPDSALP